MPEDRRNASRNPGAEGGESSVKVGYVKGERALRWSCAKWNPSPGWQGQGARTEPILPQEARAGPLQAPAEPLTLPTPPPSATGSHVGPSPYEAKNDSSFPGTLETTGELAEAGKVSDFW